MVEVALDSRVLIPIAALLLAVVLSFFAYAVHGYVSTECYADMRESGVTQETAMVFDDVQEVLTELRTGTPDTPKWRNKEFQDQIKESMRALADGRHALNSYGGFEVINAADAVGLALSNAKRIATNRVNDILRRQDPTDFDAFEKYRLEGKQLVSTVKRIDATLETLGNRTRKLPGICTW